MLKTSGCKGKLRSIIKQQISIENNFSGDMVNCMNWLGLCENYSSIYRTRTWLASLDEVLVKKHASWGVIHIIFDNLDLYIRELHHLTLPLLVFETYPTFHLCNTDEMSLHAKLELFEPEFLDLDSPRNRAECQHFLKVIKTAMAEEVCKNEHNLAWISAHFSQHHDHPHSETASTRSLIHIDPPKPLDEKKLKEMTQILHELQDRYLNLMGERLVEDVKLNFFKFKRMVETKACTDDELKEAESFLLDIAKDCGYLIIHGDLLRDFYHNI